jgi:hypothetical protein
MSSSDYPLLDVFWTMFVFFLWVAWFVLLFRIVADIFRRRDIGGGAKVMWLVFVILLPFLGVFVYLIAHSHDMTQRDVRDAQVAQAQFDSYVKTVAGDGPATQIARGKELLDKGTITQSEFDSIKEKALA